MSESGYFLSSSGVTSGSGLGLDTGVFLSVDGLGGSRVTSIFID